jgi:hypothetical protein
MNLREQWSDAGDVIWTSLKDGFFGAVCICLAVLWLVVVTVTYPFRRHG